jgi:hypothetical protein
VASFEGAEDYDLWLRIVRGHENRKLPEYPSDIVCTPQRDASASVRQMFSAPGPTRGAVTDDCA